MVRFDLERGEYGLSSDNVARTLPAGVRLAGFGGAWDTVAGKSLYEVRFFPDGSADRVEVDLADASGARLWLRVDPLTGLVESGS